MRKIAVSAIALLAFLLCGLSSAEVIKLRDGSELRGKILSRSKTEVRVELDGVEISISGEEIVSIDNEKFEADVNAMYEEQLSKIAPDDADGFFRLAEWCASHGLTDKRKELLKRVLEIDPNHEGANKAVGNVFRDGRWQTPEELKKQGLVFYNGKWMTKDEYNAARGMVKHMGVWVSKEERDKLLGRTFSRYYNFMETHAVHDLMRECMRINLFNKLAFTREQMEQMFPIFLEAEDRRQEYLRRRDEINAYVEEKYLALREAVMFGVIVSFDTPKEIKEAQGPAVDAEYRLLRQKNGYCETLGNMLPEVFEIWTSKQKWTAIHHYCRCCHQRSQCSECGRCHTGQGGLPMGVKPSEEGLQALLEVRQMSATEFARKKEKLIDRFARPITNAKSKAELKDKIKHERMSVGMVFEKARDLSDTEFEKQKFILAAQLGARDELERARIEVDSLMKQMALMKREGKTKAMWVDCLFDGTFYNLLASKLGRAKIVKLQKKRIKEKGGPMELVERSSVVVDKRALFNRICTQCHTLDRINAAHFSPEMWEMMVCRMMSSLSEEDKRHKQTILEYIIETKCGKQ